VAIIYNLDLRTAESHAPTDEFLNSSLSNSFLLLIRYQKVAKTRLAQATVLHIA